MSIRYLALGGGLLLSLALSISSCKKNSSGAPHVNPIDPDSAAGGAVLYVTGSGIGDVTSIMFSTDSVPAPFNTNFNTNGALIFRVPDTALGGPQNIIFTNKAGQSFTTPFNVLAFPSVSSVSNYDYNPGDTITLTGNNLEAVSAVTILGTSSTLPVIAMSHHTVSVVMPNSSASRIRLSITNSSGTDTISQEFNAIANAYIIFANGNFGPNIQSGSWGPSGVSNAVELTHYPTFWSAYDKGDWSANGFAYWNPPYFTEDASYTYFTFWMHGGLEDYTFYITSSAAAGGSYGNADVSNPIDLPPNVWTFFKIPLSQLKLSATSANFQQLGWWVKGPNDQNETIYWDDVMFVK